MQSEVAELRKDYKAFTEVVWHLAMIQKSQADMVSKFENQIIGRFDSIDGRLDKLSDRISSHIDKETE